MPTPGPISAVILDAFGTIVEIAAPRRPFARLMRAIGKSGSVRGSYRARLPMTSKLSLSQAASASGAHFDVEFLNELELDLATELASVRLFEDVGPTLAALKDRGLKVAVCSNLAEPYAEPLRRLMPIPIDVWALSFEVGALKPEPAIYEAVCSGLECRPDQVLFVGDTLDADVVGPRAFGMSALHLVRDGILREAAQISALTEIVRLLDERESCG